MCGLRHSRSEAAAFLAALSGEGTIDARDVMLVVAHPDDETIALGAQLPRLPGLTIVHVTDGAPRSPEGAQAHGFDSPEAYAVARRQELEAAVALAGVPREALVGLDLPDQTAAFNLVPLARRLARLFEERGARVVLTHAYEGGHPDHDATAFATHQACTLLGAGAPAVIEMPFYHAGPEGWVTQAFAPGSGGPEVAIRLDDTARALKARMCAAHATQARTLALFTAGVERFREASPDFHVLPNGGDLLYERYGWGLTGQRWQELVAAAWRELRSEVAA